MGLVSGLDVITHNKPLQEHWARRILAFIIDWLIISIPLWYAYAFYVFVGQSIVFGGTLFSAGLLYFLYSGVLEGTIGKTIGKGIMGLKVVSLSGDLGVDKALLRNVSKIFSLFLVIDWILGLATEGDPRQRYLDRIANTTVIHSNAPPEYASSAHYRNITPTNAPPTNRETTIAGKRCRSCGGTLAYIDDKRCKCKKCGLIQ